MKNFLGKMKRAVISYFTREGELNITLFKILGVAGVTVSILGGLEGLLVDTSIEPALINFLAGGMAILLLWFVGHSGKYVLGYVITLLTVFMGLFTVLFLKTGGMDGAMSYFFTFGIVFSFMMFRGKLLALIVVLQTAYYIGICVFSVRCPQFVNQFDTVEASVVDRGVGMIMAGLALGMVFVIYLGEYKKQQKKADDANREKSLFLANISHEVRTPINMMIHMNTMIERETTDDQLKEYAMNAKMAGNHLVGLVNQLLEFSRLEKGTEEINEENYAFFSMMNGLADYFTTEAARKDIAFRVDLDRDIAQYLCGDVQKITRILTNLCTNAIKYTERGAVSLKARNLGVSEMGQRLFFEVEDSGIGIKEEELSKVFDSFERSEAVRLKNIEGTGLGLAICAELAKLLGTSIQVQSEYGKGSTFSFELTQKIGEAVVAKEKRYHRSFVAPKARILIVDDNSMNLYVMKVLLKKTLIRLDTAESAEECLDYCRKNVYDLIFMDYMMPVADGIEALHRIRSEKNLNQATKVFVLTADVSPGKKEMLLSKGFAGHLTKPVEVDKIEETIASNLSKDLLYQSEEGHMAAADDSQFELYEKLLGEHDISLAEGLRFVDNDLMQYKRVCSFFLESAKTSIEEINSYFNNKQLEQGTAKYHSLKANAKSIGSIELYMIARAMEKHGRDNDYEYVTGMIPMLNLEWERARCGISRFIEQFEKDFPEEKTENTRVSEENLKELSRLIGECKQSPSKKLIDAMLSEENDPKVAAVLQEIKAAVIDIEFEQAAEALKKLQR